MDIEGLISSTLRDFRGGTPYGFPNDKLGVADKLLLRKVIENRVKIFMEHNPETSFRCAANYQAIYEEMRKYGFNPMKMKCA